MDHRDLGLRVEGRHRLGPRATANAGVSRPERRYEERTDFDGAVTDASPGVGYVMTPTMRTDGEIGWGGEQTEVERWRHTRRWVQAGITTALLWGFTVGGSVMLRWADFQGNCGFPSLRTARPAAMWPAACACSRLTARSPCRGSARKFPWCTRTAAVLPSSATTTACSVS